MAQRKAATDPTDPRIKLIREVIERNPKVPARVLCQGYSIAVATLRKWEELGFIPKLYVPSLYERTNHWRTTNGTKAEKSEGSSFNEPRNEAQDSYARRIEGTRTRSSPQV